MFRTLDASDGSWGDSGEFVLGVEIGPEPLVVFPAQRLVLKSNGLWTPLVQNDGHEHGRRSDRDPGRWRPGAYIMMPVAALG